jgi:fluoroquinolone resistance protein
LVKLNNTGLTNAVFKDCKVLGVNFHECTDFLFSVAFERCTLDHASFTGKKMVKTRFADSSLKGATFAQANLNGSVFKDCDLSHTIFERTDLSGVNFASAHNFDIDPDNNTLKKAIFSADGLQGLLTKHHLKIIR